MLSRHEKRVIFKDLYGTPTYESYKDSFFWLSDSRIANECFLCDDPTVCLRMNENRSCIKCYFGDTGLLVTHAFGQLKIDPDSLYKEILLGDLDINNGMLFENAIAQTLVALGNKLFFYAHYSEEKHRNDIEIDFLIARSDGLKPSICPIEVKPGRKYQTKSLNRFIEKYGDGIGTAYVIHPRNLSIKPNGVACIPSYMVFAYDAPPDLTSFPIFFIITYSRFAARSFEAKETPRHPYRSTNRGRQRIKRRIGAPKDRDLLFWIIGYKGVHA